jgi:hypothetical protein
VAARLCTQAQLDEMCRTGIELMHEAIDSGDGDRAAGTYARIEEARNGLSDVMGRWTASTLAYVFERNGEDAIVGALQPELWLELGLDFRPTPDEVALGRAVFEGTAGVAERMRELVAAGDRRAAKQLWGEVEDATLKMHDYRIDWLTAVISHVYRTYGVDGLSGALLHTARADWWHSRMVDDLASVADPVARITNWSFFLGVGNFGTVSVTEQDDAFVIHHQVCGSCGRQELRNRHEQPWSFPRVSEPVPEVNFGNSNYTVYRAHLPVFHFVMPIPEVGHPWPAINCSGVPGRCWFTIYKNPHDTPAEYYERAGFVPPAGR